MEWYLKVVRDNYANFNGRARRKEYWMFLLIHFIINLVLGVIQWLLSIDYMLTTIYGLAVLLPILAVSSRRFHDIGKPSSWASLVVFLYVVKYIPLIGWFLTLPIAIILIYFFVQEGDQGPNEYGPDPKGEVAYQ